MNTEFLDRAILMAVKAHAGTERRGKGFPYIVHPMEAMAIVATMTSDQELLAAAVLHDVIEDTDVSLETIRQEFGDRVAKLVDTESDKKDDGLDWHARKRRSLERLAQASREEKMVALGDKLSNIRAIARDYYSQGEIFWSLFHVKDKAVHANRYRALVKALSDLSDTYAYNEFQWLVEQVFTEKKG